MILSKRVKQLYSEGGISSVTSGIYRFVLWRLKNAVDKLYGHLLSFGSERKCPVCGWEGRKFLPYGQNARTDARCPHCDAKERHRLLWLYLEREVQFTGADILYFAPVDGVQSRLENTDTRTVITTDLLQRDVDVKSDITDLPFTDRSFDFVLCSHVLEHVRNDERALEEIFRILKPGGYGIILVPQIRSLETTYEEPCVTSDEERKEKFGQHDHVRIYGDDVAAEVRKVGFDVEVVDYSEALDRGEVQKYKLREEPEYIFDPNLLYIARRLDV